MVRLLEEVMQHVMHVSPGGVHSPVSRGEAVSLEIRSFNSDLPGNFILRGEFDLHLICKYYLESFFHHFSGKLSSGNSLIEIFVGSPRNLHSGACRKVQIIQIKTLERK